MCGSSERALVQKATNLVKVNSFCVERIYILIIRRKTSIQMFWVTVNKSLIYNIDVVKNRPDLS